MLHRIQQNEESGKEFREIESCINAVPGLIPEQ